MESLLKYKKNKKGQQTINLISGTVLGLMVMIFMIFAVLFAISTLNPGSFFTTDSAEQNATNQLTQNLTTGIAKGANYIPTIFVILFVVAVLAGIVILVAYVKNMKAGEGSGL